MKNCQAMGSQTSSQEMRQRRGSPTGLDASGESTYLTKKEVETLLAELAEAESIGQIVPSVERLPWRCDRVYIALATILPEIWRPTMSCAGLCYLQILEGDTRRCRVRVAAIPHYLEQAKRDRVQVLSLPTKQLRQMLPWDRTLQRLETCCVREVLSAYAHQLDLLPEQEVVSDMQTVVQVTVVQAPTQKVVWEVLPEVFVAAATAKEEARAVAENAEQARERHANVRLVWLRAVLTMLERQIQHMVRSQHEALYLSYLKLLSVSQRLISALKRRQPHLRQQFFLGVKGVQREGQYVGWHVRIELSRTVLQDWGMAA